MKALWLSLLTLVVVALVGGAGYSVVTYLEAATTFAHANDAPRQDDDEFGTVEVYEVNTDGSLEPAASGLTAEVWETFMRVAGPEVASTVITEFLVGDAPDSDTLAYVFQGTNPEHWSLAANLATSQNRADLIATLVHEYGHILTLGVDEVTAHYDTCPTLVIDEGCVDADSAIQAFIAEFWSQYGDDAPGPENVDSEKGLAFYFDHEDDFVDTYAATSPIEDIAESFMVWVVDDPRGGSVVAAKLAFFEDHPVLVAERDRIRAEFAQELGLSV